MERADIDLSTGRVLNLARTGDPMIRQRAKEVSIDALRQEARLFKAKGEIGPLRQLAIHMVATMRDFPLVGLAANQLQFISNKKSRIQSPSPAHCRGGQN